MEIYCAKIAGDGRVTIPTEVRAKLSKSMGRGHNAVFTHETVFIERHCDWPYVKMWVAESSDRMLNGQIQSQRSQSRMTTGRIAANVDDSYRIHIPMEFRRKTGLSDGIVWIVRGREIEIWSEQRWELAGSVCVENESILLPQHKLSVQVKRILESRGEVGPEAIAQIDSRGRLTMPVPLRGDLGEGLTLHPGLDQCLAVYSNHQWRKFTERLMSRLPTSEPVRRLNRAVFGMAFSVEMEPIGRLAIPKPLQKYVKPGREAIILVSPSCTYLWDSDAWKGLTSA
jgi:MraZ protein